ncbi:MAG TPA: hypothetical protein VGM54_13045 [Chthoniobacter sp.]|jgi:hypothetical protein
MPVVYLVDDRISHSRSVLENIPKTDVGISINPYLPLTEIVPMVIRRLAGSGENSRTSSRRVSSEKPMITELRIVAHGHRDQLLLGWGIDVRNAAQLAPLSPMMRTGASGRCLLLGYNVTLNSPLRETFLGGSDVGQRFGSPGNGWGPEDLEIPEEPRLALVRAIARTLGVPATAGLATQRTVLDSLFLDATVTVDPFGRATFTGLDTPTSPW